MIIVPSEKRIELSQTQKLVIAPLSDIHWNAKGFDRDKWLSIIEWIAETAARPDRKVLVPLIGDYLDTMSASERRAIAGAAIHESTRHRIEDMILGDLEGLRKDLEPIKDLILGVVSGNHTFIIQQSDNGAHVGKSTDQILAEALNVPFFGVCGAVALNIKVPNSNTKANFKVLMHHGFGMASTKGASINQMVKLKERFDDFDLYIMGHNHIPIGTVQQTIVMRKNNQTGVWRMKARQIAFVRGGSFLKGYLEGEAVIPGFKGSYVEEKCYVPAGLGIVTCNVRWQTIKGKRGGSYDLVVHVQE